MKLGAFSVSLAVKDIAASLAFYEKLGFAPVGGDITQNWLILRNGETTLGLFQGMFDQNCLTFNPGWNNQAEPVSEFEDVRRIQQQLKAAGVALTTETDADGTGPGHIALVDPDGNPVLIDHMFKPAPLRRLLGTVGLFAMTPDADALNPGFNYDESRVPAYALPDPLINQAGEPVTTAAAWQQTRRGEILTLFADHVYGRVPDAKVDLRFELLETDSTAFDGTATRKQVRVHISRGERRAALDILLYLPRAAPGPVPLFVGLNFNGNHTVSADPAILLNENWMREGANVGVVDHRANAASRGTSSHRWAISTLLARGYGFATIYCGDIDPDFDDGFQNGVHPLFYREGQTHPEPHEWGTVAAWAWGLSRAMDYFATDADINARQVAVMGHSRLGKAALWAGANDERFALVISNESGCGGAALARRRFGETVQRINTRFPHWFNGRHQDYNEREAALPVDQHELIALIAPRPVYIASAEEDLWSDPRGEFLAGKNAEPVYALFGKTGLGVDHPPGLNHPVGDFIGYHLRTGKHDVTDYDWAQYLNFADRHFGRK